MATVSTLVRGSMPKVTLYVKDADSNIWERARKLAGDSDSLSRIVTEALAAYVPQREAIVALEKRSARKMKAVELKGIVPGGIAPQKVRFVGALLFSLPKTVYRRLEASKNAEIEQVGTTDLYLTGGGTLVVHENGGDRPHGSDVMAFRAFTDFEKPYGHRFANELDQIAAAMKHDFTIEID
jgi:hypothetical protein